MGRPTSSTKGPSHALQHRHPSANDRQLCEIEPRRKNVPTKGVEKMASVISRVTSTFDQCLSFTRREGLDDHLRPLPGVTSVGGLGNSEEHGLSARKHLRAVRDLTFVDGRQPFGRASIRGTAEDPHAGLAEDKSARVPRQAVWEGGGTDRHRRATADGKLLQEAIREKSDGGAVR